jgi:hypothetical protein
MTITSACPYSKYEARNDILGAPSRSLKPPATQAGRTCLRAKKLYLPPLISVNSLAVMTAPQAGSLSLMQLTRTSRAEKLYTFTS